MRSSVIFRSEYQQGIAIGVLQLTEATHPQVYDKEILRRLYRTSLRLIGQPEDAVDYWVDYYLSDRGGNKSC